jgi:SAM-dependent methyltransferase
VVTYFEAVAKAPPGASHFAPADLRRLPASQLESLLDELPAEERQLFEAGDEEAGRRLVKASFWTLVYNLEPARWDALSKAEPIHPGLLATLPADGARVLEVAAGTGRLTVNLAERARRLIAIEPVAAFREILEGRVANAAVLPGTFHDLPVADRWADLSVACASLGPDRRALAEMERCTRRGGTLALISPEQPEWFEGRGFRRLSFKAGDLELPPHDPALEAFFGPLDPPHELVMKTV